LRFSSSAIAHVKANLPDQRGSLEQRERALDLALALLDESWSSVLRRSSDGDAEVGSRSRY
jgi:hypothetical protein